jgi:hypothetical protein
MSRPARITGVGHRPVRTSSYAEVRPMPSSRAAVGRSTTTGRRRTSMSLASIVMGVAFLRAPQLAHRTRCGARLPRQLPADRRLSSSPREALPGVAVELPVELPPPEQTLFPLGASVSARHAGGPRRRGGPPDAHDAARSAAGHLAALLAVPPSGRDGPGVCKSSRDGTTDSHHQDVTLQDQLGMQLCAVFLSLLLMLLVVALRQARSGCCVGALGLRTSLAAGHGPLHPGLSLGGGCARHAVTAAGAITCRVRQAAAANAASAPRCSAGRDSFAAERGCAWARGKRLGGPTGAAVHTLRARRDSGLGGQAVLDPVLDAVGVLTHVGVAELGQGC